MAVQRQGLAFAQKHCSICHAIDTGISPKPEAPSFEAIINTPGLTAQTLNPWLQDSHNFPEIMNFEIAPEQIDTLAAYMLTLKNADYRPRSEERRVGKECVVRVVLGGRRILKNKKLAEHIMYIHTLH